MLIDDLVGTWDMVHDEWRGTLVINPPGQLLQGTDGACTYSSYVIDGTYGQGAGALAMHGTFGGEDRNRRTGEACPQSEHLLNFTIDFPNQTPQEFTGYLFTRGGKGMGGHTWWQGIPFGWYAVKR